MGLILDMDVGHRASAAGNRHQAGGHRFTLAPDNRRMIPVDLRVARLQFFHLPILEDS